MDQSVGRRHGVDATRNADYLEIRECLLTNLQLLQFEDSRVAIKNGISLSIDMFVLPNQKAYETVMYFLFFKLDPSHKKFRDCWPIVERKQEACFRKVCIDWLKILALEVELPRNPGQVLISPYGRKFCTFLLDFSSFILEKEIEKQGSVHLWDSSTISTSHLMLCTNLYWENYQCTRNRALHEYGVWKKEAIAIMTNISLLQDNLMKHSNRFEEQPSIDQKETIENKSSEVMKYSRVVDEICLRVNKACESTNYCLSGEHKMQRLDGAKLHIDISSTLLNEAHRFGIKQFHLDMFDRNGCISLVILVRLFNSAKQLLLEKYQKGSINKHGSDMLSLALQQSSRAFNQRLLGSLENVEDSMNKLLEEAVKKLPPC